MEDSRDLCLRRAVRVIESGIVDVRDHVRDPARLTTLFETVTLCDSSLAVKLGVHFTLFGGTIMHLGTERHQQAFVDGINTWGTPGSFAMTELGHGSNVQGVETIATYDKETQEFIIETPTEAAQKYWIGNAACNAQFTSVFAQLIINGENKGVHVFVVRVRNKDGSWAKNVRIGDNGHKMGLVGVDNGRFWFDRTRIPRENLLNRFADVSPDGSYSSPFDHNTKRFGAMVAPLVGGRVMIALGAVALSKVGLYIAIKYGLQRRQFEDGTGKETLILDYITMQRRLYPRLADTYAYNFALNWLKVLYAKPNQTADEVKTVHIMASGLKALATWHRSDTLQHARECCGGQGFSSYNRIGIMKTDSEVDLTYEGDNTVLLQQVARSQLADLKSGKLPAGKAPTVSKSSDMRNIKALVALLEWREVNLLQRAGQRLAQGVGAGKSQTDAWNSALDLSVASGRATVERVTLQRFEAIIDANPAQAEVLTPLAVMYGMGRVAADLGYFVSYGGLAAEPARGVSDEINGLCGVMHQNILVYVDAIDYPKYLISAPIAGDYVAANRFSNAREEPVLLC
eukprot:TRINITY_DN4037_c0_g1_i3.p2 TRINITY_DN4037_c0_g1~~TRINITY_DN4037_c0_g1_i3.p2  ORF type:complete len:571 (+),score=127.89 TRINITY_DN4037_c0_g1_i3:352-2064(+)